MGVQQYSLVAGDWINLEFIINDLARSAGQELSPISAPEFVELTLSGLTANSLVYPDSDGLLTSLGVAANGQIPIGSTGTTPVLAEITGTANQITVTNGVGSITLSTPQDINTGASFQVADINVTDEDTAYQIDGTTILRTGTSTNYNMFLGEDVFSNDDEGTYNVGIGYKAGYNNDTGGGAGTHNVYIGYLAGQGAVGADGTANVFIGSIVGSVITTAANCVGIGKNVFAALTSGQGNFALGSTSCNKVTTGGENVGIGVSSLANIVDGRQNVAIGMNAGLGLATSSEKNVFIGWKAGDAAGTKNRNVGIGSEAATGLTIGLNNTFIGYSAGGLSTTADNCIYIGNFAGYRQTTADNLLIIDNNLRASTAVEQTDAIIYGMMHASIVTSQSLRFNVGNLTLASGTPYQYLLNTTAEDTDGGRESQINFKGTQSGDEVTTLARIQASHVDTSDDEKGRLQFYTNTTSDGDSPTLAMTINELQYAGLGTSTPVRKLTIVEDGQDGIYIIDTDSINVTTLGLGLNTSSGYSYIQSGSDGSGTTYPLTLWVASTKVVNIDTSYNTQIGDGGTTNYTEIEADGTVEFHGAATVWNDANLGVAQLALPTASQPDEDEFVDEGGSDTGITTWAFAIGEKVSGSIEIPHDYKEGSDLYFHIHWQGIVAPADGTDNVNWQLTYTVAQKDETLDAATTITKEIAIDTQYDFKLSDFAAITGTNFNIGDQFLFTIERIAASEDDYAGDALVATVGIHYECDTCGSRQIFTK